MAIYINKATILGRLGADPEIKGRDASIVTLRVATAQYWRDKQTGERQERTQWHQVVIFSEPTAKYVVQYAKKGDLVCVEGAIETRKWERGPNDVVWYTEIVVRPFGGSVQVQSQGSTERTPQEGGIPEDGGVAYHQRMTGKEQSSGGGGSDYGDEIPF